MFKWIPVFVSLLTAVSFAQSPDNLLSGADFESPDATGWVAGWFKVPGSDAQVIVEDGNHFVRLHTATAGTTSLMQHEADLPADWKAVHFSVRVRYDSVVAGKKGWNDARVQLLFLDDKHKTIGKPEVLDWTGTLKTWLDQSCDAGVPVGAVKVKIQVGLFDAKSGTLDVDDLKLTQAGASKAGPGGEAPTASQTAAPTTQPLPYTALDSNFKSASVQGKEVAGWYILAGTPEVVTEKDGSFLHLQASDAAKTVQVRRFLPLNPDWAKVTLAVRVRYKDVKHGDRTWQNAHVIVEFVDDKGKPVGTPPEPLNWRGSSKGGWSDETHDYIVPFGAKAMKLDPALLAVQSGTLDLESLSVTATESRSAQVNADVLPEDWKPALTPHWQDKTATRQRICLNGVWQIRPIGLGENDPKHVTAGMIQNPPLPTTMPAGIDWGYGKVPSTFPGSKETAQNWALPKAWTGLNWGNVDAMWFRRSIDVPADWKGQRIVLDMDTLQSQAAVFVNDKLVGQAAYPAGAVDLTDAITPGQSAMLTLLVIAKPFEEARVHAMNPSELYLEATDLKQRGLCGDVFLRSEPAGPRLIDVQYRPSVREKHLGLHVITASAAGAPAKLKFTAKFGDAVETEWASDKLTIAADGSADAVVPWVAAHVWDIDSPNLYQVSVSLIDDAGKTLDERTDRIGYREMWLDGRDIMLNGSPIHWRVTKIGNEFGGRSKSQMAGTFSRMRQLGFNCMILDYDFYAGSEPTYTPMFEAADEAGVLMVATIPSLIPWKGDTPDAAARKTWETLADYCIGQAQNHPSVLAYATNHNRLGYIGSLNPDKLDGKHDPVSPEPAFGEKRKIAADAEAYIRQKDPTREVYHHSAGNFGTWETTNCYLDWMPLQEKADYVSHWSTAGVKPLFLTEYGMPFVASFGQYRGPGVYKPTADSQPWFLEYSAAWTGAHAYENNATQDQYVDSYEAAYAKTGKSSWSVLTNPWMRHSVEWNYVSIQAQTAREVFPALRTYGLSAILPWDYKSVANWTDKTPAKVTLTEPAEQWTTPGIHPDFLPGSGYGNDETWFNSPAADTFKLTDLAAAYKQVNADVLAWIAGEPDAFSERSHVFSPGQKVTKQVIVINDLRHDLSAKYDMAVTVGDRSIGSFSGAVTIAAGRQKRDPVEFTIPADAKGDGLVHLTFTMSDGTKSEDQFAFQILPTAPAAAPAGIALWDPKGDSDKTLQRLGLNIAHADKTIGTDVKCLLIGRQSLTVDGPAPDIKPLLDRGGRVVVFEQSNDVLTQRLGFRTATPSLRQVFIRTADHPILAGLTDSDLHDWNGDATLTADKLTGLPEFEAKYPAVDWLGFRNSRVWKVNNRGQVASVVIEKPQTGDFTSLADGGFDLQYSPLLLAHAGNGQVLFCQMDVTGRSAADPAADRLIQNILQWGATTSPVTTAPATYVGDAPTHDFLASLGAQLTAGTLPTSASDNPATFIIGPGTTAEQIAAALPAISKSAGTFVFLCQSAGALKAFGQAITVTPAKIVADSIPTGPSPDDLLAGVGASELHLRGRTAIDGVFPKDGWHSTAGVLAEMQIGQAKAIFVQLDPREFDYTKPSKQYVKLTANHTRTLLSRVLASAGVQLNSPLLDLWSHSASQAAIDLSTLTWQAGIDPKNELTAEQITAAAPAAGWQNVSVPGDLQQQPGWTVIQGTFWYRVKFDVPSEMVEQPLKLTIGNVDDEDTTYLNGKSIGHVGKDTNPQNYYRQLRQYAVPKGLLKTSGNVLVIKGNNIEGPGGILEGPVRLATPLATWQASYYQDSPAATDDPYRYYRW